MAAAELTSELSALVPPGGVLTDPAGLFCYESDGFTIAKARPGAVVFPTSTEQVVGIVKLLAERDIQIVPRGSGTRLTGGYVAFENDVIVSTTRMNSLHANHLEHRVGDIA